MNPFDIKEFTAEIDGQCYFVTSKNFSVTPIRSASADMANGLSQIYEMLYGEMMSDPGLRHCDSGYAFAKKLKERYKAKIWNLKRSFYPSGTVF